MPVLHSTTSGYAVHVYLCASVCVCAAPLIPASEAQRCQTQSTQQSITDTVGGPAVRLSFSTLFQLLFSPRLHLCASSRSLPESVVVLQGDALHVCNDRDDSHAPPRPRYPGGDGRFFKETAKKSHYIMLLPALIVLFHICVLGHFLALSWLLSF